MVLRGSGECAEVQWTFLALSIPEWTLLMFIAFILFGLWLIATRSAASVATRAADRTGAEEAAP